MLNKTVMGKVDELREEMNKKNDNVTESIEMMQASIQRDREIVDTKLSLIDESVVMKKWVNDKIEELSEKLSEKASKMED